MNKLFLDKSDKLFAAGCLRRLGLKQLNFIFLVIALSLKINLFEWFKFWATSLGGGAALWKLVISVEL